MRSNHLRAPSSAARPIPPFQAQTLALLESLERLDLLALEALLADPCSAVEATPDGRCLDLRRRADWLQHLRERAAARAPGGGAGSGSGVELRDYRGVIDHELGYSAVRFQRHQADDPRACMATVVWALTPEGWKVRRWHCSLER